jgi:hypothetical protein
VSINVTTPSLLLSKGLCFSQKNHPIYCSPGGWWVPDFRYVVTVFAFAKKIFNNIFLFWLLLQRTINFKDFVFKNTFLFAGTRGDPTRDGWIKEFIKRK